MIEVALIDKVIAVIGLVADVCLFWFAWKHRWRDALYVWLIGVGVFNVITQWTSGLTWLLAEIAWIICAVAFLIAIFVAWRRLWRKQAELDAERQRAINEALQEWHDIWNPAPIVESQPVEGDTDHDH